MRRIVLWMLVTITVVVLLFGYHTSTASRQGASSAVAPSPGPSATAGTTAPGKTVTGPVVDTQWGPVQVQITVQSGSLTGATVLQHPHGTSTSREINNQALPVLVKETVDAKSANIDMVSGATVTSEGYAQSLQAALDQAGG